jgi:hypothetical protein
VLHARATHLLNVLVPPFDDPITGGRQLVTLLDAGNYITGQSNV